MDKKLVIIKIYFLLLLMVINFYMIIYGDQKADLIDSILTNSEYMKITDEKDCYELNENLIKIITSDTSIHGEFLTNTFRNNKFKLMKKIQLLRNCDILTCLRLKYIDSCDSYIFLDYELNVFDSLQWNTNFYMYLLGDSMKVLYTTNAIDLTAIYPKEPYVFPMVIEFDNNKSFISLFRGIKDGFLVYEEFQNDVFRSFIGLYDLYSGLKIAGKNIVELIPIIWGN